jgi:hypothetical protein
MDGYMKYVALVAAYLLLAALSASAAQPNFSGNWKLNDSTSDFDGMYPPPKGMTAKIIHKSSMLESTFKQPILGGDREFTSKYTTDGTECTGEWWGGSGMKSVLRWDGDTLVFDSKAKFGTNDVTMQDKWTLSADGKTLTIVRNLKIGEGVYGQALAQRLVMEREAQETKQ